MNNKFGISDKSFALILDTIRTFDDIDRASIFGSRAKGNFKKGSDVDIAIFGDGLLENTADNLSSVLNERIPIPYFVDVVAPYYITNQELIDHIERVGINFYTREDE